MFVDLKVHVELVHYKGRQGSNMRPRDFVFFWVRDSIFFGAKDFANYCTLFWDPRER